MHTCSLYMIILFTNSGGGSYNAPLGQVYYFSNSMAFMTCQIIVFPQHGFYDMPQIESQRVSVVFSPVSVFLSQLSLPVFSLLFLSACACCIYFLPFCQCDCCWYALVFTRGVVRCMVQFPYTTRELITTLN